MGHLLQTEFEDVSTIVEMLWRNASAVMKQNVSYTFTLFQSEQTVEYILCSFADLVIALKVSD